MRALCLAIACLASFAQAVLPLTFQKNHGQIPSWAEYAVHGSGTATYVARDRLAWQTKGGYAALRWLNTDRCGVEPLGRSIPIHDLRIGGHGPSVLHSEVATKGLYPGIDLRYRGSDRKLEYVLDLEPGADPGTISFRLTENSKLDANGEIVGTTSRWRAPIASQRIAGKRVIIPCQFIQRGDGSYGFAVGDFDRSLPLEIDPILVFSTTFGGNGSDFAYGLEVDSRGALYITGQSMSLDLPLKGNPPRLAGKPIRSSSRNAGAVFVAKLSPNGQRLEYMTLIGGNRYEFGVDLYLDKDRALYIAGMTQSTDFPCSFARPPLGDGVAAPFVLKMAPDGSRIAWSRILSAKSSTNVTGIVVDRQGNPYIAGSTTDSAFPARFQLPKVAASPVRRGFVAKFDSSGKELFTTLLGSTKESEIHALAVTKRGEAVVCGATDSAEFPVTSRSFGRPFQGVQSPFVTKLSADGSAIAYSGLLASTGLAVAYDVTLGDDESAYICGNTYSGDLSPTSGAWNGKAGLSDVFAAKISPSGSRLIYLSIFGGANADQARDVAVNEKGEAFIVGFTASRDFPQVRGDDSSKALRPSDVKTSQEASFITQLAPDGSKPLLSALFGGSGRDLAFDATYDRTSKRVYVLGTTQSRDFPITSQPIPSLGKSKSDQEAFIVGFEVPKP